MTTSRTAESAIRNYLTALRDPGALRDDQQIAELQKRLEKTDDPVERLRLRGQLKELETPSVEAYEADFITHAKAWADEHGIDPSVFLDEGVSASVLRRAGFRGVRDGQRGQRQAGRGRRQRRSRVGAEEVRKAIPSRGKFTIKRLQEKTGASAAVARKVISEEMDKGVIAEVGSDEEHQGPGRAPKVFERVGKSA